ncbi:MAG: hypothetical protein IKK39_05720, partial [Thermoguttaceae bacterium]|nr:hypothetical protein [Thermoguttaceae bacterium]
MPLAFIPSPQPVVNSPPTLPLAFTLTPTDSEPLALTPIVTPPAVNIVEKLKPGLSPHENTGAVTAAEALALIANPELLASSQQTDAVPLALISVLRFNPEIGIFDAIVWIPASKNPKYCEASILTISFSS